MIPFTKFIVWSGMLLLCALLSTSVSIAQEIGRDSANEEHRAFNGNLEKDLYDQIVDSLKEEKSFLYANDSAYWVEEKQQPGRMDDHLINVLTSRATRTLFILALIGVGVFVLYRIAIVTGMFNRHQQIVAPGPEDSSPAASRENIDLHLQNAIREERFRDSIRFLYLKTLFALDEKSLINFDPQSTNQQYVSQLSTTAFASDFVQLSRVFDYVWYGEFAIDRQQFSSLEKEFTNFYNNIES